MFSVVRPTTDIPANSSFAPQAAMSNPTVSRQSLKFANTYRRLTSPADHERSLCQPILNASDLRPLSNEPQPQQRIVSRRDGKAFVDDPTERLDAGTPQVLLKGSGL
jgi:hypothetical protein